MTLAERMAAAGPNEFIAVTDADMVELGRAAVPTVYSRAISLPRGPIGVSDTALSPPLVVDGMPARHRKLFDRIVAMDRHQLAAMERCAGMIEGLH